jgi:hypothetical protein
MTNDRMNSRTKAATDTQTTLTDQAIAAEAMASTIITLHTLPTTPPGSVIFDALWNMDSRPNDFVTWLPLSASLIAAAVAALRT